MKGFLRIFDQRVRGVRLFELIGLVLVFVMIFWVCLSKAREGDDIRHMNELDQQIADEQAAVDTLKIKVSQLERPARLEALATQYLGMKPVDPAHEADVDSLSQISRTTSRPVAPTPPPPAATIAATTDDLISAKDDKNTSAGGAQ